MSLGRMDLDDYGGNPSKIVMGILNQLPEINIPISIREIAQELDIIQITHLSTSGYVGGLVIHEGDGIILVNENDSSQRQRFTIGHELGHFLIPWHTLNSEVSFNCTAKDMTLNNAKSSDVYLKKESEANRFSAELLMPAAFFRADTRKSANPNLNDILSLANKYDVSKEACARRYVDLHDEPSVVVFSQNGKIRYYYKHDDFPYLEVKGGAPLPKSSFSYAPKTEVGGVTEIIEVDTETWVSDGSRDAPQYLLEQTVKLTNGYQMTLLFAEEANDETDEDIYKEPSF